MSLPVLSITDGPYDGAHRLTVTVEAPTDRWEAAAGALARDIEDAKRAGAWDPSLLLELVGWAGAGCEAYFYLAGSVLPWVAFAQSQLVVPVLSHLPLVLDRALVAWTLERRKLEPPTYAQTTGCDWPFAIEGPTAAQRVEIGARQLGREALEGLVEQLGPALRRSWWERGMVPDASAAFLDGNVVVLPFPGLRASAVLEVIVVWAQLFWVEVEWVRWTR
jgi:hypothetical protein